jgi:hypothetical protein
LNKVIEEIIKFCHKQDPSNIFRYPVDKKLAPGYDIIIEKPICLEEINSKAKR